MATRGGSKGPSKTTAAQLGCRLIHDELLVLPVVSSHFMTIDHYL